MTCREADRLMEHVLDGNDGEGEVKQLHEHLGHCDRCTRAWRTAEQVRSMMGDCEPADPGDEYFAHATLRIMARIRAAAKPAEEAPVIRSLRYGPLAVRGGLTSFLFAVGLLVGALVPRGDDPAAPPADRLSGTAGLVPALAHVGAGTCTHVASPAIRDRHVAAKDANHRPTSHDRPLAKPAPLPGSSCPDPSAACLLLAPSLTM